MRQPTPAKCYSPSVKIAALNYIDLGWSPRDIEHYLGVPHRTIYRWWHSALTEGQTARVEAPLALAERNVARVEQRLNSVLSRCGVAA